ncbi:hypothetical protein AAHE18_08G228100 [Arachis hypogaea]
MMMITLHIHTLLLLTREAVTVSRRSKVERDSVCDTVHRE